MTYWNVNSNLICFLSLPNKAYPIRQSCLKIIWSSCNPFSLCLFQIDEHPRLSHKPKMKCNFISRYLFSFNIYFCKRTTLLKFYLSHHFWLIDTRCLCSIPNDTSYLSFTVYRSTLISNVFVLFPIIIFDQALMSWNVIFNYHKLIFMRRRRSRDVNCNHWLPMLRR